jgi:hypothetical protein
MTENIVVRSTNAVLEQKYYSVLSQMAAAAGHDRARMRSMIYDLARMAMIRNNLYPGGQEVDWSSIQDEYRALEAAIEQVEASYTGDAGHLHSYVAKTAIGDGTDVPATHTAVILPQPPLRTEIFDTADAPIPSTFFLSSRPYARDRKPVRWDFWWTVQLTAAAALGVVIYIATGGAQALSDLMNFHEPYETQLQVNKLPKNTSPEPQPARQPSIPAIPLPTTYGFYALSNGQLIELDSLPIRVPDPRIAVSAAISAPSRAHLPSGQLQFIVFKRDLINNAPDKASLRVVARVVRALTFDPKGKAKFADVDATWVVRGNSYIMKVAPIANNPEMIVIRPENADFVFPAGRYALVLQNSAHDFTVDGSAKDAAHCLERTDALNAPVYTECRNP